MTRGRGDHYVNVTHIHMGLQDDPRRKAGRPRQSGLDRSHRREALSYGGRSGSWYSDIWSEAGGWRAGPAAVARHWQRQAQGNPGGWWSGRPYATGNRAFDEYRAETLRRLEEEQREFKEFLDRLRHAKDKAEFDDFMAERRRRPPGPTPAAGELKRRYGRHSGVIASGSEAISGRCSRLLRRLAPSQCTRRS